MVIGILVLIGMWFECLLLIFNSLYYGVLFLFWGMFYFMMWDLVFLVGLIGLFFLLLLILLCWVLMFLMFELCKLIYVCGGVV